MRLTRIEIRKFRSIRHLVLDLGETTVVHRSEQCRKDGDPGRRAARNGRVAGGRANRALGEPILATRRTGTANMTCPVRASHSGPRNPHRRNNPETSWRSLDCTDRTSSSGGRRCVVLRVQFGRNGESGSFDESWEILDAAGEPVRNQDAFRKMSTCCGVAFPCSTWVYRERWMVNVLARTEVLGRVSQGAGDTGGAGSGAEGVLGGLYSRLRDPRLRKRDARVKNIMRAISASNPLAWRREEYPDPSMQPED